MKILEKLQRFGECYDEYYDEMECYIGTDSEGEYVKLDDVKELLENISCPDCGNEAKLFCTRCGHLLPEGD